MEALRAEEALAVAEVENLFTKNPRGKKAQRAISKAQNKFIKRMNRIINFANTIAKQTEKKTPLKRVDFKKLTDEEKAGLADWAETQGMRTEQSK